MVISSRVFEWGSPTKKGVCFLPNCRNMYLIFIPILKHLSISTRYFGIFQTSTIYFGIFDGNIFYKPIFGPFVIDIAKHLRKHKLFLPSSRYVCIFLGQTLDILALFQNKHYMCQHLKRQYAQKLTKIRRRRLGKNFMSVSKIFYCVLNFC